jgi:hypothetical protein
MRASHYLCFQLQEGEFRRESKLSVVEDDF